jgi:hypothetical protein
MCLLSALALPTEIQASRSLDPSPSSTLSQLFARSFGDSCSRNFDSIPPLFFSVELCLPWHRFAPQCSPRGLLLEKMAPARLQLRRKRISLCPGCLPSLGMPTALQLSTRPPCMLPLHLHRPLHHHTTTLRCNGPGPDACTRDLTQSSGPWMMRFSGQPTAWPNLQRIAIVRSACLPHPRAGKL